MTPPTGFDRPICIGGPMHGKNVSLDTQASSFHVLRDARLVGVSLVGEGQYEPELAGDPFEYHRARNGGFEALVPAKDADLLAIWHTMLEENRARGHDDDDLEDDLMARLLHDEIERRGLPAAPVRRPVARPRP